MAKEKSEHYDELVLLLEWIIRRALAERAARRKMN